MLNQVDACRCKLTVLGSLSVVLNGEKLNILFSLNSFLRTVDEQKIAVLVLFLLYALVRVYDYSEVTLASYAS